MQHVLRVTGGSRGIGAATARLAARRGYAVCVNYRANEAAAESVVSDIERDGGKAVAVRAKEVASDGIRMNAIRPGVIATEIHASGGVPDRAERIGPKVPVGRAGSPEECAFAILWLLSPEASYVTGTILDVSGGR